MENRSGLVVSAVVTHAGGHGVRRRPYDAQPQRQRRPGCAQAHRAAGSSAKQPGQSRPVGSIEVASEASAGSLQRDSPACGLEAIAEPGTVLRLFGKPESFDERRLGVALARGENVDAARAKAKRVATKVKPRR
jgi:hypothetical protein